MKITPEFAEIIGVYVGDGYLRYKNNCGELDISGSYEEKNYYDNHLIPLFNKTFDAEIKGRYYPHRKTYGFRTSNKDIIKSFKELGFSSGAKSTSVRVPRAIMETDKTKIIAGFLKGYFDTDGCVTFRNRKGGQNYSEFKRKFHYYPRIQLISVSKKLIEDVCILLNKLEIKYYTSTYKPKNINWKQTYKILIAGPLKLNMWINKIGTKNPCKVSRIEIWKEHGFCPPFTTYNQRINILEGKLNPKELYGPVM